MTRALRLPVTAEQAQAEMRAAGYEPQAPYPGRGDIAWPSLCAQCGQPRRPKLNDIRNGVRCKHQIPLTAQQAVAEMRAAGYEPRTPYPGKADASWPSRCTTCGQNRGTSLTFVRQGARCTHTGNPKTAEDALRALGYEPAEPYPGRVDALWSGNCTTCGHRRRSSLSSFKRGVRCAGCSAWSGPATSDRARQQS